VAVGVLSAPGPRRRRSAGRVPSWTHLCTRAGAPDGDERGIAPGWLAFHRDALAVKCPGLTDDQLVDRSALSLLGVLRHMAEMERAYGGWALGPKVAPRLSLGTYENGAEHDIDCDASMVQESLLAWREEMRRTDEALARHRSHDGVGEGNGYSVRWNVVRLRGC
jgi:hypothetical protein